MIDKNEILNYLKEIKPDLKQEGVADLGLFGSFARNEATDGSDIDILVKFESDFLDRHDAWTYFEILNKLKKMLMHRFHRSCDVLDLDCRSPIIESVAREAIYV